MFSAEKSRKYEQNSKIFFVSLWETRILIVLEMATSSAHKECHLLFEWVYVFYNILYVYLWLVNCQRLYIVFGVHFVIWTKCFTINSITWLQVWRFAEAQVKSLPYFGGSEVAFLLNKSKHKTILQTLKLGTRGRKTGTGKAGWSL